MPKLIKKYVHSDDDLALEEFDCNTARADIAILNGAMHAFEIKSDSDSLYRLKSQMQAYEGVFDLITVVVGRRLLAAVEAELPEFCGLILAERIQTGVKLTQKKHAKRNPNQRGEKLARLLWKGEALQILRKHGCCKVKTRSSANLIWSETARHIDVKTLSNEVRAAIKLRFGLGSARQLNAGDDSLTTESTALLDHYSENLEQLLSVLSRNHRG